MIRPFYLYRTWVLEPVAYAIRDICRSFWWFFRGLRYVLGLSLLGAGFCALYELYTAEQILFLWIDHETARTDGAFIADIVYGVYALIAIVFGTNILVPSRE
ncbi:hypothetical protein EBR66_03690 [bacterium]|nr:hypothetical protein [bacterium]